MSDLCKHERLYDPDGDICCYDCGKVIDEPFGDRPLMLSPRDRWMMGMPITPNEAT